MSPTTSHCWDPPRSLPMTVSPLGRHQAGSPGAAQVWNKAQALHSSLTRQNKQV